MGLDTIEGHEHYAFLFYLAGLRDQRRWYLIIWNMISIAYDIFLLFFLSVALLVDVNAFIRLPACWTI